MAEERKDGVVVGGERQLRLAALSQLAVLGDDLRHHLVLGLEEGELVLLGEVAVLSLQLREARLIVHPHRIAPGEVEPDLQIADLLGRELSVERPRGELEVSGRLLHPQRARRLPHPAQDEVPLFRRQLGCVAAAQVQEQVDGALAPVILDLREQRRDQVEGGPDLGIAVHEGGHLVVVLGAAQSHPGQQVGVGEIVLVVGLMHVPHKGDVQRLHLFINPIKNPVGACLRVFIQRAAPQSGSRGSGAEVVARPKARARRPWPGAPSAGRPRTRFGASAGR